MAVLARNIRTGMFLVRGKDEFELYWTDEETLATKFNSKQEASDYLQNLGMLWRTEVFEKMEIVQSTTALRLENLPEGKKFQYLNDGRLTFLKLLQPCLNNFDPVSQSYIGDTDARYYFYLPSDACWCVIIDNHNDNHHAVRVGRVITLNSGVLVREVQ